jgi:hypothetical protein
MSLRDLEEFTAREPIAAALAAEGLSPGKGRADDVFAEPESIELEVSTLAELASTTERNLIGRGKVVLRGHEPNLLGRVEDYLGAVLLEETATTLDALKPWWGYTDYVHRSSLVGCGPGLGVLLAPPGPLLYPTPTF